MLRLSLCKTSYHTMILLVLSHFEGFHKTLLKKYFMFEEYALKLQIEKVGGKDVGTNLPSQDVHECVLLYDIIKVIPYV